MKVAVIGAGASGLVSARECLRQDFEVVVFEANEALGGVWVFNETVEDDLLGQRSSEPIHSSMYASLRTNIPRDLMAFSDYTFDSQGGGKDEWERFPHHTCVRHYLENFADEYDVSACIRYSSRVTQVLRDGNLWRVSTEDASEKFDAVAVCNGHYAKPRMPSLAGLENFRGTLMHSHNYRRPSDINGPRVAIWGTAASGLDLTFELGANEIYWFGNAFINRVDLDDKRTGYPNIEFIDDEGRIVAGEYAVEVDTLLFCTGYQYDFPFLLDVPVKVEDGWVHPLYHDVILSDLPSLGFIGLPFLIIPFPIFEIQAKWFTRQLKGVFKLPSKRSMLRAVRDRRQLLVNSGKLQRHFHRLGEHQFNYFNQLAAQCGEPGLPEWFVQTWRDVGKLREQNSGGYKDVPFAVRGPTICRYN